MYDTESAKWTLITEDTGAMGGPQLIFDHQMVMDVEKQQLFVFGGRVLTWQVVSLSHSSCVILVCKCVSSDLIAEINVR